MISMRLVWVNFASVSYFIIFCCVVTKYELFCSNCNSTITCPTFCLENKQNLNPDQLNSVLQVRVNVILTESILKTLLHLFLSQRINVVNVFILQALFGIKVSCMRSKKKTSSFSGYQFNF